MSKNSGSSRLKDAMKDELRETHGVALDTSNNTIIFKGVSDVQRDDGTYDYYYWDIDDFSDNKLILEKLYNQLNKRKLSLGQIEEALRLLVAIKSK